MSQLPVLSSILWEIAIDLGGGKKENINHLTCLLQSLFSFREKRAELLAKWRRKGGIFLISYTAFRNLSLGKHVKDRNMARDICYALQVIVINFNNLPVNFY